MSKRKYDRDVSEIVYGVEYAIDNTVFPSTGRIKDKFYYIPMRIVRESFYRKLIKVYEACINPETEEE